MTSNLGAREVANELSPTRMGFGTIERTIAKTALNKISVEAFKRHFLPEFVNRIDKMVVFHPLSDEGLKQILNIQVKKASDNFESTNGIRLSLSEATQDHLIEIAKQSEGVGARPLIRALNTEIKSGFGRQLANGKLNEGMHVRVYHRDEVPAEYLSAENQKLVFMAKADDSIARKVAPHHAVFSSKEPGMAIVKLPQKHGTFRGGLDV